jgi:polygalacturonase
MPIRCQSHLPATEFPSADPMTFNRKTLVNSVLFAALVFITSCAGNHPSVTDGANVYNVKSFGATGDGKHLDNTAISAAIAACSKAGGGTVLVPPGTYLCGSIRLASNINLLIDPGATILGAPQDMKAYDPEEIFDGGPAQDEGHTYFHNSLIWGENLTNVSITGRGTINGGGLLSQTGGDHGNKSIALKLCKNVLIRDITIAHGGWFAILATGVNLLTIDNVIIDTNRDGMDLDCCQNTTVSNCRVNSPRDDGIVPKSTLALGYPVITQNMTITNCQVSGYREGTLIDGSLEDNKGGTGRIKFGTESTGGFRNITVSNCTFSHCRGLAIEEVDGGTLENITVTNLSMDHVVQYPIFIRLGDRHRGSPPDSDPLMKNIFISNVIATGISRMSGIQITGLEDFPIEGVRLQNIHLSFIGHGTLKDAYRDPPELETGYPEPSRFGTMPAYGLYARHVRDLELANIHFDVEGPDLRPAMICEDVDGLQIDDLQAQVADGVVPAWFYQVENTTIRNSPQFTKIPTTRPTSQPASTMPTTDPIY